MTPQELEELAAWQELAAFQHGVLRMQEVTIDLLRHQLGMPPVQTAAEHVTVQ